MLTLQRIAPCLWFADQAEAAAEFYIGIFPDSRIDAVTRYPEAGREIHGQPPGSVMTVAFTLDGQQFTALNGGPRVQFNEAISLQVLCDTPEEVDAYWQCLGAGGNPDAQQCGWLKDRHGVSWQVVPRELPEMLRDPDPRKVAAVMGAVMRMKKIDLVELRRLYQQPA